MNSSIENKKLRACIQDYPVDLVSLDEAVKFIENIIKQEKPAHVVTINPEMIAQAVCNRDLDNAIKNAELIIPDGIGVVLGLKTLGINIKQLPGIEFSEKLIEASAQKGYKIAFLGASQDVLDTAILELSLKYPGLNIVFSHNGFFKEDDETQIIEEFKKSGPDILFVALGVPKQELWISKYKKIFNRTIMVGVGGSFDVWAKKVKRAPVIFRKLGLEWFFRLISQPSRFSRMFPTLPLFLLNVILKRKYNRKEY